MTVVNLQFFSHQRLRRSWWLTAVLAVLLLGAFLLQAFRSPAAGTKLASVSGQLGKLVPETLPGWQAQDLPLGPNELVRNRTTELLQYDDYVYRQYVQGLRQFAVYAAYWSPGKMPTRLVSTHTPDRCWTENGWKCIDQKFGITINHAGFSLRAVQWRIFEPPAGDTKEYVLFWLLVGGKPYDFGQRLNTVPNPMRWWLDVVEEATSGNQEQFFVRVTSHRPFEELAGDPAWEELLRALGRIGRT